MRALKIEKKTDSKTQQIKLVLSIICLLNNITLSETDYISLAFFIQYKMSHKTDDLIIKSGVVKNMDVLRNVKTRLCKKGFLKRDPKEYKTYDLNMSAGEFNWEDNDIRLIIKLNN